MTDQPLPTWITEGAKVAVYNMGTGSGPGTVRMTTVVKVQKLHVVTEDGAKYRRTNLESIAQRSAYSSADQLAATDDPRVITALKSAAARNAVVPVWSLTDKLKFRSYDPDQLLREVEQLREAANKAHTRLMRIIETDPTEGA